MYQIADPNLLNTLQFVNTCRGGVGWSSSSSSSSRYSCHLACREGQAYLVACSITGLLDRDPAGFW